MATRLKNLTINELSFVDVPANSACRVTILKRDGNPLLSPPANPLLRKTDDNVGAADFPDAQAAADEINQRRLRRTLALERQMDRIAQGVIEDNNNPDFLDEERARMSAPDHEPKNLDEAAADIEKAEKVSRCVALTKARQRFPFLYEAHNAGAAPVAKTTDVLKAAERAFNARVHEVLKQDHCSVFEAYQRAARQFPVEREAFARGR